MSKNNEKRKAELKNDIRKAAKQEKIRIQIRKRKVLNALIIMAILSVLALIILFIRYRMKVQVKDEDVSFYQYFLMSDNEKFGVIDREGKIIIQPEYDYIQIPNPEKPIFICLYQYQAENNSYQSKVINDKGDILFTEYHDIMAIPRNHTSKKYLYQNNILTYQENGKYGIITTEEKQVTKAIYDEIETLDYQDGILKVLQNNRYGLIKLNGDSVIKPQYYSIESDGYYTEEKQYTNAGYIVGIKTETGYRYGYVNAKGKEILECKYTSINRLLEMRSDEAAYLITSLNGKLGFNKDGQVKIKNDYEQIEYDDTNKIILLEKNGKFGLYDLDGNMILPVQYEDMELAGKIITASKDGKKIVFDANGSIQKESTYINVIPTEAENYFITIKDNGKYGLVDNHNDVLMDNKFDYLEYAFDNYFIYSNNGKYGVIDNAGNAILQNVYDIIQHIHGTKIIQVINSSNGTSHFLNKNMKPILEISGAHIYLEGNNVKIISNNTLHYLDLEGNLIEAKDILSKNQIFAKEQDGKWGYVNAEGKVIVQFEFDLTEDINEYGYGAIKKDGKWGVVDSEGAFILDPTYELDDIEPIFIGEYYKTNESYEVNVFTK